MKESRTKKTTKNIFSSFVFQFLKIFLVFANRIVFVRVLGPEYLGINGLFSNILSILSLADLGLNTAMMYSLYKPLADNDKQTIAKNLNYFKKIYNYIFIAVIVFGISLTPFLKYLVNLPKDIPHIYVYYYLLLANSAISYLFVYKTVILSADQKMHIINKYNSIFEIVLFIMRLFILIFLKSFTLYLLAKVLCTFISNLLKVRKTKQLYTYIDDYKESELTKLEKKKIFENVSSSFFYKIGSVIQSHTDNILISILVGTIVVGYYSNYITVISSITNLVSLVFNSLKASLGNYVVSKDKEEQYKMYNILEVYNFILISFCTICLYTLIPDFIQICFGKQYVLSNGLLICAILNFYTSNIRQTLWAYRETTGLFKRTKYITLVTAILNLFLSIILGKIYGLVGIVGATVLARMLYAWWREPLVLFNEYFKKSAFLYYKKYVYRLSLTILLALITKYICNIMIIKNIYLDFILSGIISVIIPSIIYLIAYRNNDAIKLLLNKVKITRR